jgi:hypothetical protein
MNPRFHLDQDVNQLLKQYLNAHYNDPDCAKTATELDLHLASDGHHLLRAAQAGRIFVTHNGKDFITMQDAWERWSKAWGVQAMHAGILIFPQRWLPPRVAEEIVQFLGTRISLPNEIYAYDVDPNVDRWVQNPVPKRSR